MKTTRLMLPRDAKFMPSMKERYDIEIIDGKGDLIINQPYRKKGNREKLDMLLVETFDYWRDSRHPLHPETRDKIYHQRLFLGQEGLRQASRIDSIRTEPQREEAILKEFSKIGIKARSLDELLKVFEQN